MAKRQKTEEKQVINTLAKELHDLVTNKQLLRSSVEQFFYDTVDELTIAIIFDLHRKYKTNAYDLELNDSMDEDEDSNDMDVFSQQNFKKPLECECPNCGRNVGAARFAPHLHSCMGKGRLSRNASRRAASVSSKDTGYSSSCGGALSDDEAYDNKAQDQDWNPGEKKKTTKRDRKNNKKNRGTPNKTFFEAELVEAVNIDIEGDDEELTNLRSILHLQDHSNSTSPADSASSSGSTMKREKSKKKSNKQNKIDRLSPYSNASAD